MGSFNKLKQIFSERERFVLVCHMEPDGDGIGSMLALRGLLKKKGKTVQMVCKDSVPAVFRFLPGADEIENEVTLDFDTLVLLDNGDLRRTGISEIVKQCQLEKIPVVNIDHHQKNDIWKLANINHVDSDASSASEIVYDMAIGMGWEIDSRIATQLLAGIYNDTGGFRHSNTTEKVFFVFSELLKKGAKLNKISENMDNSRPVSLFKLWGIALNKMTFNSYLGMTTTFITREDMEKADSSEDDIPGLVNLINSSPESKASLLLCETKDGNIKGSLRTERDDVDVSKIAQMFGGGGHKKAAGFTIKGEIKATDGGWKII